MVSDKEGRIKPLMPTGFRTGVFPDESPPVASLTIDTQDGAYTFAINEESCAILKEVVAYLETIADPNRSP